MLSSLTTVWYPLQIPIYNAAEDKYGAWSLWDPNASAYQYTQGQSGGRYFTFQLSSALFGGSADKYLPMSAINGLRIVLSCENVLPQYNQKGYLLQPQML